MRFTNVATTAFFFIALRVVCHSDITISPGYGKFQTFNVIKAVTANISNDLKVGNTALVVSSKNIRVGIGTATPSVTLEVNGTIKARYITGVTFFSSSERITTSKTISTDTTFVDASAQSITATLPSAVGLYRTFRVKRIDASTNGVSVTSSSLIDGVSSLVLKGLGSAYVFVSDGSNWFVF